MRTILTNAQIEKVLAGTIGERVVPSNRTVRIAPDGFIKLDVKTSKGVETIATPYRIGSEVEPLQQAS